MKKNDDLQASEQELPPSKSEIKRQMLQLQELGKKLLELNKKQLQSVPLNEELLQALQEHQRIKSHEARRRQLQRIGKLMRSADHQAIQAAVDLFDASSEAYAQHFQQLELWRERLIQDESAVAEFIERWPACDIQKLRQLIRNARKERDAEKPPAQARKLFRYLREVCEVTE
ncbi:ribosome-associated protein [Marinospirillum celere]|uniref:Dual-action ribosomal maturation protein DarP n=1 Tax=Marinospirillum celere TaxID=1122252 RepID=A0A1I1G398_9GAMM|nr:ribosome biogenesis factor YjgA [Marinospirillum celere]SFC03783.1 ribosome-associated protein [Marinospirillum celere]